MKPFKFQEGGTSPQTSAFGTPENPIELQGVEVTAKKLNWLEKRWNDIKWAFRNVANDINRQADLYVANHRRAEERNPNYNQEHDAWNNFNEFMNTSTGGLWKNSSPSQAVGTVANIVRGEPVLDSWMNFNNGVVGVINEDWANEHPYLTMAGNMIFDGVALNAKPIARGTVNTAKNVYNNGWYRPPARMRYIFSERPSIITTAERMGIPKSERHLRTHGHDYSNPSSYGKLYQNRSVNPESNQFGKFIDEGSEALVFDDPTNPHMVLKVNTDWRGPLQEFYTNYVLKRNRVPNQKPIILRGITEEGFPVFNQEKVTPMTDDQYFQNLPKIREMLHNKGFIGDPEDLGYMSNGVMKIGDFNPGNVAFDSKGNIVFIDIDAYKRGGKINEKC